jgi:hypothetical protein
MLENGIEMMMMWRNAMRKEHQAGKPDKNQIDVDYSFLHFQFYDDSLISAAKISNL